MGQDIETRAEENSMTKINGIIIFSCSAIREAVKRAKNENYRGYDSSEELFGSDWYEAD